MNGKKHSPIVIYYSRRSVRVIRFSRSLNGIIMIVRVRVHGVVCMARTFEEQHCFSFMMAMLIKSSGST